MEIITTSQNSNTHAYPRLEFPDVICAENLTRAELEKEKEAALSKITQLEREGETALSKIVAVKKKKQAALIKICKLKREKERTAKIAVLETEKQAASIKIEELEKEKEDAARKITLLEKELETKEEKFGKHMNTQLQKEEEIETKFEDFERHINAEHKKEKGAAICKITALETKEVRAYKQAVRALREIQEEDKEPKEKVKELTITVQKLTEERQYWEALAKKLKGKESEAAELVEARKEMNRVWVFGHFYEACVLQLCLTHCSFKAAN
ncbi:putative phospholipase A1-IIgamma-like [Capsicum annuum]|nr:putative phospholipase A1-IIgamma-like [Capsicum annuum]